MFFWYIIYRWSIFANCSMTRGSRQASQKAAAATPKAKPKAAPKGAAKATAKAVPKAGALAPKAGAKSKAVAKAIEERVRRLGMIGENHGGFAQNHGPSVAKARIDMLFLKNFLRTIKMMRNMMKDFMADFSKTPVVRTCHNSCGYWSNQSTTKLMISHSSE
jgi:hypothetical protein